VTNQAWLQHKERGNLLGLVLIATIARVFGRRLTSLLLHPICLYFLLFHPKAVAASRGYLARVLDVRPGLRHVYRHLFTYAQTLLDRVYLYTGTLDVLQIRRCGDEVNKKMKQEGTGALYISAHMGSFDAAQIFGSDDLDLPIHMMMYEDNAENFRRIRDSLSKGKQIPVIPLGYPDTMIRAKQVVDNGEAVAILGDRTFGTDAGIVVPFMGGSARFPLGPFMAAAVLKAPLILFIVLYRGGNLYEGHFELLAENIDLPRKNREQGVRQLVELYARRLEYYCRMEPYNWFNFYEFWVDDSDDNAVIGSGKDTARST